MAKSKHGLFFVKTLNGSQPAMATVDLKGATAYYEGSVLRASQTSGSAAKAAAGATAVLGVCAANVTSSATTTQMPVYLADSNNVFEAKMIATGLPKPRLYDKVKFTVGTIHNYRLEGTANNGAATACIRIVGYHPDDVAATSSESVRYWVTFTNENSLVGNATNAV